MDDLTLERVRRALNLGSYILRYEYVDSIPDAEVLSALLAALDDPARWCGVVGGVEPEIVERPDYYGATGRLIVRPHAQ